MILTTVLLGVLGAICLRAVYRHMAGEWPDKYMSVSDLTALYLRNSLLPYVVAFRGVPVLLTGLLIATFAQRSGGNPLWSLVVLWVSYTLLGEMRAVVARWRTAERHHFYVHVVVYGLSALWNLAILAGAWAAYPHATEFIPELSEFSEAVWTAIIVVVFARVFRSSLPGNTRNISRIILSAREDMGEELWESITWRSREARLDGRVVRSIVIAEVLQRPKWLRRVENVVGRWRPGGTYGVAQVYSDAPIDDEKPLVLLIDSMLPQVEECHGSYQQNAFYEASVFRAHNSSPEFVNSALEIYRYLTDRYDLYSMT